jgi:hypothetical protein
MEWTRIRRAGPREFHPEPLTGRVGDWRAGLGRSLCSPLTRSFVCECHTGVTGRAISQLNQRKFKVFTTQ